MELVGRVFANGHCKTEAVVKGVFFKSVFYRLPYIYIYITHTHTHILNSYDTIKQSVCGWQLICSPPADWAL